MPLGGEECAKFFSALGLAGTHLAAAAGIFVATNLVLGFGENLRDLDTLTVGINGDEGEVGRGDMAKLLLADVFDHGLDADFHGGAKGAIDAGLEDEQVANLDRSDKVKVIHGRGDGEGARVAAGGHGADEINELHQAPAEEIAQSVGIAGEDDLTAFRLRGADGAC